jgi:hypothetical protein
MTIEKNVELNIDYEIEGDSNTVSVYKNVEIEIFSSEIISAIEGGEFDDSALEDMLSAIKERIRDDDDTDK